MFHGVTDDVEDAWPGNDTKNAGTAYYARQGSVLNESHYMLLHNGAGQVTMMQVRSKGSLAYITGPRAPMPCS